MGRSLAFFTAWLAIFLTFFSLSGAAVAEIWKDYVSAHKAGRPLPLHDWSWAGYRYSQMPIPDIAGPIFDVTKYGAVGDGSTANDVPVQAAIDAAERAGGGVIFFPKGTYMFGKKKNDLDIASKGAVLRVSSSNIVFRGVGSANSESVLQLNKEQLDIPLIEFAAKSGGGSSKIAVMTATALRDTRTIQVDTVANLQKEKCFRIRYGDTKTYSARGKDYVTTWFGNGVYLPPAWTRLAENGIVLYEYHCIAHIDADSKTVHLTEPLKLDFFLHKTPFEIWKYRPLQEVGMEDLRLKGSWNKSPGQFCHHCSPSDDWAFTALWMRYVRNFWIRNVDIRDWNQGIRLYQTSHGTIRDVRFMGKRGHHSIESRQSFGNLVMDCKDLAAHHHGPSVSFYDEGLVYLRHEMEVDQRIDLHSSNPSNTLFDDVKGGILWGSGGALSAYPNHGANVTFWNFKHRGNQPDNSLLYRFWPTTPSDGKSGGTSFSRPRLIGLYNDKVKIDKNTVSYLESLGTPVEPKSLFTAQLCLRLGKSGCPNGVPKAMRARVLTATGTQRSSTTSTTNSGLSQTQAIIVLVIASTAFVIFIGLGIALVSHKRKTRRSPKSEPKAWTRGESGEALTMESSTPNFRGGRLTLSQADEPEIVNTLNV